MTGQIAGPSIFSLELVGLIVGVSMVLGAVMLVDSPMPELRIHWATAIALALPFTAITVFLLSLAIRARRTKVETGIEGMIGELGSAVTDLAPAGKVFVHGEYWDAVSPAGVAVDGSGNVFVADTYNNTIRKITPDGAVSTLAGSAENGSGFADGNSHIGKLRLGWVPDTRA